MFPHTDSAAFSRHSSFLELPLGNRPIAMRDGVATNPFDGSTTTMQSSRSLPALSSQA